MSSRSALEGLGCESDRWRSCKTTIACLSFAWAMEVLNRAHKFELNRVCVTREKTLN